MAAAPQKGTWLRIPCSIRGERARKTALVSAICQIAKQRRSGIPAATGAGLAIHDVARHVSVHSQGGFDREMHKPLHFLAIAAPNSMPPVH